MFFGQHVLHNKRRTTLGRNRCFKALLLTDSAFEVETGLGPGIIDSARRQPSRQRTRASGGDIKRS